MSPAKIISGVFAAIALFAVLSVVGGSFYTVDEGEKAIVLRNGAVTGVADAGFHWKAPWVDDTKEVSLRDGMIAFDEIKAYTRDGQTATVHRVSIGYRAKPANESVMEIYTRYGTVEQAVSQMVTRRVGETLETVFGQFTADTAIQKRAELGAEFTKRIRNIDGPVEILSAQIENFSLPDSYEQNIEAKMTQEVEVKKLEQKALQAKINAEIAVTNAQAQADSQLAVAEANAAGKLADAKAVAEGNRLIGEADAAAIKAKSDALSANPNLIEYQKALTWNGALPTTMTPNAAIPFLPIK